MSELARLSSEIYDLLDRASLLLRYRLSQVSIPTHVHSSRNRYAINYQPKHCARSRLRERGSISSRPSTRR